MMRPVRLISTEEYAVNAVSITSIRYLLCYHPSGSPVGDRRYAEHHDYGHAHSVPIVVVVAHQSGISRGKGFNTFDLA